MKKKMIERERERERVGFVFNKIILFCLWDIYPPKCCSRNSQAKQPAVCI